MFSAREILGARCGRAALSSSSCSTASATVSRLSPAKTGAGITSAPLSCRLEKIERKRSNLQDMAAEGLITFEELRAKLRALQADHA